MVRYPYILCGILKFMAMQEVKQKSVKNPNFNLIENTLSSTRILKCYVCGKGLTEGFSITAKTLPSGTIMFCNVHY